MNISVAAGQLHRNLFLFFFIFPFSSSHESIEESNELKVSERLYDFSVHLGLRS